MKIWWKLINSLSNLLLLALIVVVLAGAASWYASEELGIDVMALLKPIERRRETGESDRIVKEILAVQELTTAIATVQSVVPVSETNTFAGLETGSTKLLYVSTAEVRAGVDLSEMEIVSESNGIRIVLPAPTILVVSPNPNHSQVYDISKDGWFPPDNQVELLQSAQATSIQRSREAACTTGILDRAQHQTETVIRSLVALNGINASIVSQPITPESCDE